MILNILLCLCIYVYMSVYKAIEIKSLQSWKIGTKWVKYPLIRANWMNNGCLNVNKDKSRRPGLSSPLDQAAEPALTCLGWRESPKRHRVTKRKHGQVRTWLRAKMPSKDAQQGVTSPNPITCKEQTKCVSRAEEAPSPRPSPTGWQDYWGRLWALCGAARQRQTCLQKWKTRIKCNFRRICPWGQ